MYKAGWILIFSLFSIAMQAQNVPLDTTGDKVQIIKSEYAEFIILKGQEVRKLRGKVRLYHKDAFLLCDSALMDNTSNNVSAYGNVVIIQGDSVNIFADSLIYNGFTRVADLYGDVVMRHGAKKLFTTRLNYNLATKVAVYSTRATLADEKTQLSSNRGYYYVPTHEAFFKDSVIIMDPDFSLKTDTLKFNTQTNVATFLAPTLIQQDSSRIYCESGFYDIEKKNALFMGNPQYLKGAQKAESDTMRYDGALKVVTLLGNARFEEGKRKAKANKIRYDRASDFTWLEGAAHYEDESQKADADTIRYNSKEQQFATRGRSRISNPPQLLDADEVNYSSGGGLGYARGDVFWQDTAAHVTIRCDWADYDKAKDYLKASGHRPMMTTLLDKDTLWMRADTIVSLRENPSDSIRTMLAYHQVRIFSPKFQGNCDSLTYSQLDSTFRLYTNPIVWSDTSQFTADTIQILTSNRQIDRIFLRSQAFIINSKDELYFNQIKGRDVTAYFETNELRRMLVEGNAESVYYALDDRNAYVGVNKTVCSEMLLYFGNNQVRNIKFYNEPKATMTPMRQANHDELRMKGFRWEEQRRPRTKLDL